MAKKKAKSRPPARKRAARKAPARGNAAQTRKLHGFFHKLYSDSSLMQKFSSGPEGRRQVLDRADLSAPHKTLLKKGCVPDIIHALVGAPATAAYSGQMVNCSDDEVTCGHPHCVAFSNAAKTTT